MESAVEAHLAVLRRGFGMEVDKWRTLIDNMGVLAPVRDRLLSDLRVCARTELRRGEAVQPRCSRLGGFPELPTGAVWPRAVDGRCLWFLGQIDLADVGRRLRDSSGDSAKLPSEGLLSFFALPEPGDDDEYPAKVMWTPAGVEVGELAAPDDLVAFAAEWSAGYGRQGLFGPVCVRFETELVLPPAFDVVEAGTGYDDPTLVALLAFGEMTALRSGEARVLGWPEWGQDSVASPNERLLLQLRCSHPAVDPVGVCFGEGDFSFLIDEQALAESNWDAARVHYESG